MESIILASGSPRRKKLLRQINLPFRVEVSHAEEDYDSSLPASDIVQLLARRKAETIAGHHNHALIIGADTIVVHRNNILEKPADAAEARSMLQQLSDERHIVYTGVALCKIDGPHNRQIRTFAEQTEVTFGQLHSEDIRHYVESGNPMDKAGAYGIQDDYGALFVKKIYGDYNTVIGLPLHALYQHLQSFAPSFLAQRWQHDD